MLQSIMLNLCWCEDSQFVKWFKMSSHSECFTELYNLIRHVSGTLSMLISASLAPPYPSQRLAIFI